MTFGHWVLVTVVFLALLGFLAWDKRQSDLLDRQSPVVETCVKHRVSDRVEVHSR